MSTTPILPPRLSRATFILSLIVIFTMAMIPLPEALNAFSFQDKLEHCSAFLVLMLLGWSGWPSRLWSIAAGLLLYGVLIELAQHFFTLNRVGDPWDVVADASGLLIGAWLIRMRGQRDTSIA
ncbi:MAG: VanZ family protein [Proteobacteria bacterium]|nr:VanZ family protein [Pseudomonadota bacterium]